ncbi:hypothetical protein DB347_20830 [Opitutaceae bacterium EW11]|nr:hypothetical protein DB347_20830 [Opitutaceae bacterium EW11]
MYSKKTSLPPPSKEGAVPTDAVIEALVDVDAGEFRLHCEIPRTAPLRALAQAFHLGGEFAGIARSVALSADAFATTEQAGDWFSRRWFCEHPDFQRNDVTSIFRADGPRLSWSITIHAPSGVELPTIVDRVERMLANLRGIFGAPSHEYLRTNSWAEAKTWGEIISEPPQIADGAAADEQRARENEGGAA